MSGLEIFNAWSDEKWIVEGASLNVSIICASKEIHGFSVLDGVEVRKISTDLRSSLSDAPIYGEVEKSPENLGQSFIGVQKNGGFDIDGGLAREWLLLPSNPNGQKNCKVLRPLVSGRDITERMRDRWIIDFSFLTEQESSLFEVPFHYVELNVKPERLKNNREIRRRRWWLFGETMPKMRERISKKSRYLITSLTAKHRIFIWSSVNSLCDSTCVIVPRDDDATFGILHSRFHEIWALRMGTSLEDRPRYTPSTTFETFPFPDGLYYESVKSRIW